MTVKGLAELFQAGQSIDLIDVCMPRDFREVHIGCARNVPLERLDAKALAAAHQGTAQDPLYVVGRSGTRSQEACEKLDAAGATIIVHVKGGVLAWEAADLPVVHGRKSISLDPQVSLLAGVLAVAGSALAAFVHPAWGMLAVFAGGYLIYTGIMDK
ncbi:MAG: rhodanese-like domain-containing protein [Planctomycetales bacterium]